MSIETQKINKIMKEMFRLQNHLNNQTNGEQWVDGTTKEGRTINWKRCIWLETAEATESLAWKHWKSIDTPDDIENVRLEVVDVWHFLMSDMIATKGLEKSISLALEAEQSITKETASRYSLIDALESMAKSALSGETPLFQFFTVVRILEDFDFEDIYKLYIGKNCLNQFRQDNGYKDGSYIKIWNGKEDNVYMQQIMEENPDIGFETLYEKLGAKYKETIGMQNA